MSVAEGPKESKGDGQGISVSGKIEREKGSTASGVYIHPRGVIVVRCMVIGRLAASILTTREPQITRKLKLSPQPPSPSSASARTRSRAASRASIRRLNTLLGSYTVFPWRSGFEFSLETQTDLSDLTCIENCWLA